MQHSAFRIPSSAIDIDSVFARLDDDPSERTEDVVDEEGLEQKQNDEEQDSLDLWSVLYGLD